MKPLPSTAIVIFLVASSSAGALAQSLSERFDRLDRNGDGKVDKKELPRVEVFKRFDRNGDGVIERSEIQVRPAARRRGAGEVNPQAPDEPAHTAHRDIRYAEIEGVDPNLLGLDLYVPKGDPPANGRPTMIMIHGGGWRRGDKANPSIVGAKMRHFVGAGYIYATVNYRLSSKENGIKHSTHAEDCARAVAWIHDRIADYGGDPGRLHLMGHSAGAHLAGILGANERFLEAEGKRLSILKSNVLLDTAAIDIPRYLEMMDGRAMTSLYHLAFGEDPDNWRDASPQQHVAPGKGIPPTLVFYGGDRMALNELAPAFARSLTRAGSPSQAIDVAPLDHGQINSFIGTVGDPMTALIMRLHAGEDASTFPDRIESYERTSAFAAPPTGTEKAGPRLQAGPRDADEAASIHGEAAADYSARHGGRSVLALQNGRIVFERYDNGYGPETATHLHSATKGFWGPVIAAMIEDGLIESFDERATKTLPEWEGDRRKNQVTLRHLLNLSAGLVQDLENLQGHDRPTLAPDLYRHAVGVRAARPPGAVFQYGPSCYYVLGEIMKRKLASRGQTPLDYLKQRILDPIGVDVGDWTHDASGNPHIPNGASLTARDWAKYGQWLLQRGAWNGEQLVRRDLLEELVEPSQANPGHGLALWLNRPGGKGAVERIHSAPPGAPGGFIYHDGLPDLFAALGAGKCRLYIIPSLEMVVLRQGDTRGDRFVDGAFLSLLLTGQSGGGAGQAGSPSAGRFPSAERRRTFGR